MQLPHNSFVVVADGKKMLFFRNEGDAAYPKLEVERTRETADALTTGFHAALGVATAASIVRICITPPVWVVKAT